MSRSLVIGLVIIAVIVLVAVAAKVLPGVTQRNARADKIAECAGLQAELRGVRVQGGDATRAAQLEAAIAACIEQANALGANIDAGSVALLSADTGYEQIRQEYDHYRSTDYSDAVKRNNTRNTMLRLYDDVVTQYANATAASTTPEGLANIRASILRSLDAAIQQANCYVTDGPGCGRFGVNEPHGDDKYRDMEDRAIRPLAAAYHAADEKLRSVNGLAHRSDGDNTYGHRSFAAVLLQECERDRAWVDAKFQEYKSVDYSDYVRRQNIRNDIRAGGAGMVTCYTAATEAGIASGELDGLNALSTQLARAIADSTDRYTCYANGSNGCGRIFDTVENSAEDKAHDEDTVILSPLRALAARVDSAKLGARIASIRPGTLGRFNLGPIKVAS